MSEHSNQEKIILDTVTTMSNNWDNFKSEYQNMRTQVKQIQTCLARPAQESLNTYANQQHIANYLRKGEISMEIKEQYFTSSSGESGLMLPEISAKILSELHTTSPMRRLASVETVSGNELDIFVEDGKFNVGWALEQADREKTDVPTLQRKKIMVHELYAQPMATQRLVDDSVIDIERWIVERLVDSFAEIENEVFINGNGENKPRGILCDEKVEVIESQEDELSVYDIIALMNKIQDSYFTNAAFLMNRATLSYIQTLQDENGRFIWQPSYVDSKPETLFGIPLYCTSHMPTMSSGKKIIALADFKSAYKIVDRQNIFIMRDHYTHKPFVKFYSTKRVGADVVNPKAIKLLKLK